MALDPKLLEVLCCPEDKGPLLYVAAEQLLYNPRLRRKYKIEDDVPVMLIEESSLADASEDARLQAQARGEGATAIPEE